MEKKIGIIGLGRLGLTFGLLCKESGYDVCGYEINQERKNQIANKILKTPEPKVEELLNLYDITLANNIQDCLDFADLIFILVATPSKEDGSYNHDSIDSIVKEIKSTQVKNKTLVVVCTTMPTYCESIQNKLKDLGVTVVYNASFISQGFIYDNLQNADIVLIGNKNAPKELFDLYKDIMVKEPNFKVLSSTAAEITKISLNCFLTTKISFSNKIGEICINSGVEDEINEVLNAIGEDSRVGNKFLKYGFGYSGVCLPRDNRALGLHALNVGVSPSFQEIIDNSNNYHLGYLYDYFTNKNKDKQTPFTFYQLSYKRGVDILVDSQPLNLCLLFLQDGYKVNIIESESVIEQAKPLFEKYKNNVTFSPNIKGIEINLL